MNKHQLEGADIKWIFELKQKFKSQPDVTTTNTEQAIYLKQWDKLRISGQNVFREGYDQNGNIHFGFIVPNQLRDDVLKMAHDSIYGGHLGQHKTWERIRERFYWPQTINNYVNDCEICQQCKPPQVYNKAQLIPIRPTKPREIVTMDITGPLPTTKAGYKYILVICDHFTKWVELFPLKTMEAGEVALQLRAYICRHGIPESILSDQGTNFQSELMSEVFELLDVYRCRTSPYHPQSDGITERANRTFKGMLKSYIDLGDQDTWDANLDVLA